MPNSFADSFAAIFSRIHPLSPVVEPQWVYPSEVGCCRSLRRQVRVSSQSGCCRSLHGSGGCCLVIGNVIGPVGRHLGQPLAITTSQSHGGLSV